MAHPETGVQLTTERRRASDLEPHRSRFQGLFEITDKFRPVQRRLHTISQIRACATIAAAAVLCARDRDPGLGLRHRAKILPEVKGAGALVQMASHNIAREVGLGTDVALNPFLLPLKDRPRFLSNISTASPQERLLDRRVDEVFAEACRPDLARRSMPSLYGELQSGPMMSLKRSKASNIGAGFVGAANCRAIRMPTRCSPA